MKRFSFDYDNMGGMSAIYAIPAANYRRIRTDYPSRRRTLELYDYDDVIEIALAGEDQCHTAQTKGHDRALGTYYDVDIRVTVPKWSAENDRLQTELERGRWLVLARDNNGTVRLYGTPSVPLRCSTDADTGGAPADRNQVEYRFRGRQSHAAPALDMDEI